MKRFEKLFPCIVVVIFAAWLAGKAVPRADEAGEMKVKEFGKLPVVFQGRVKPYDTLARNSLAIISDREVWTDDLGHERPAIDWLLDVISGSKAAYDNKVFRIHNEQVLALLKLEPRTEPAGHRFRYSLQDIHQSWEAFLAQYERTRQRPEAQHDAFDKKVMELAGKLDLFQRLEESHQFPPLPAEPKKEDLERAIHASKAIEAKDIPRPIAPVDGSDNWMPFMRASLLSIVGEPVPTYRPLAAMLAARHDGDAKTFNRALEEYRSAIAGNTAVPHATLGFETFFNHFAPFYHCSVLYLVAFLLACFAMLAWGRPLNRAAFWIMVLALIVHTWALGARIYISGYPPITNLYGTAIFIGWACVIFGLAIEGIFKMGVGNLVAGIAGFTTLLIAHFLAGDGDTLQMMQAVLDTKFWLATHVIVINLGYAATFLAGLLAIYFILRGVLSRRFDKSIEQTLGRMIYGILSFALLFSFVGTVLGGLWADDSWGRFWGWDPKENGALMIVLWNALILHARWGGMVKPRGIAVLALGGNILTAWSWWGVNQLGVGLHSYGFTEGIAFWLMVFVVSQLLLMTMGMLPRNLWRSSQPVAATPDPIAV